MNNRLLLVPIFSSCSLFSLFSLSSAAPPDTNSLSSTPAQATTPLPENTTAPVSSPIERPSTYTVVSGDTLWDLAHKFHCSVSSLKKLNGLKKTHLKLGQVLKIPSAKTTLSPTIVPIAPASAPHAKNTVSPATPVVTASTLHAKKLTSAKKMEKTASQSRLPVIAQPVQDFDISASTFASCPVPPPSSQPDSPAPSDPIVTTNESDSSTLSSNSPKAKPVLSLPPTVAATAPAAPLLPLSPTQQPSFFANFFHAKPVAPSPSGEWGNRFLEEARTLGEKNICYDESWRPDGESRAWEMDCSNTTRYLYRVTAGIALPRTASDQYYYLHLQNKAWDVPQASNGFADCNFLRANLKPGDLLFWENTYKPERQPPITHVMVFLGSNDRGQWIMAGSQSGRGGEHNRRHGGPDVYVFDPTHACGGYTTWLGLVHHQGRFCAYGRPLEADVKKLAVAAND